LLELARALHDQMLELLLGPFLPLQKRHAIADVARDKRKSVSNTLSACSIAAQQYVLAGRAGPQAAERL
jgi:hypothetical protein